MAYLKVMPRIEKKYYNTENRHTLKHVNSARRRHLVHFPRKSLYKASEVHSK